MDAISPNYRAFYRDHRDAPIIYALYDTSEYHTARMRNCSAGGMYFESDHNSLTQGAELWIKMVDYSPDVHGHEAPQEGYRGEVMWCRKISDGNSPCYGVGVRFMVDRCDRCGERVPHAEMHKTDDLLFLCSTCLGDLDSLPDGKIKRDVENYLMGNVV